MITLEVDNERDYWEARVYDRLAVWGEEDWDGSIDLCLAAILPHLGSGDLLDLGCGPGRLTIPVAQRRRDRTVFGVDASPGMVVAARLSGATTANAVFICNDGRSLNVLKDESFDGAWSMLLFQHIPADAVRGYIAEVARVLRHGGTFRSQFVAGEVDEFMHRHHEPLAVTDWCEESGLEVTCLDVSGLLSPNWAWITAVKP